VARVPISCFSRCRTVPSAAWDRLG
jgi:hypothetical protein